MRLKAECNSRVVRREIGLRCQIASPLPEIEMYDLRFVVVAVVVVVVVVAVVVVDAVDDLRTLGLTPDALGSLSCHPLRQLYLLSIEA